MTISVRYFASLREALNKDGDELDAKNIFSVKDVWQQANGHKEPPRGILCAVNCYHASFETQVNEGDEVAFFPPVTGG
ncbi:MAG: MoaD/ThiS family protein [Candidatus Oxydemutatoraceae bacterium WSBS_2016_MAG_OTU14]